jgi:hypothetical protein
VSEETQRLPAKNTDDPTASWEGSSATGPYSAPTLSTLAEFVRGHKLMSQDEFLAAVTVPYLVLNAAAMGESTPALVMTQTSEQLLGAAQELRVAPLAKRPGANTFSMMVTVGRTDNNDIVIKHTVVSKFHAYFRTVGDGYTLVDAGSLNGTWLDGKRCAPERSYPLKSGCQIKLGGAVVAEYMDPEDLYRLVQDST